MVVTPPPAPSVFLFIRYLYLVKLSTTTAAPSCFFYPILLGSPRSFLLQFLFKPLILTDTCGLSSFPLFSSKSIYRSILFATLTSISLLPSNIARFPRSPLFFPPIPRYHSGVPPSLVPQSSTTSYLFPLLKGSPFSFLLLI